MAHSLHTCSQTGDFEFKEELNSSPTAAGSLLTWTELRMNTLSKVLLRNQWLWKRQVSFVIIGSYLPHPLQWAIIQIARIWSPRCMLDSTDVEFLGQPEGYMWCYLLEWSLCKRICIMFSFPIRTPLSPDLYTIIGLADFPVEDTPRNPVVVTSVVNFSRTDGGVFWSRTRVLWWMANKCLSSVPNIVSMSIIMETFRTLSNLSLCQMHVEYTSIRGYR